MKAAGRPRFMLPRIGKESLEVKGRGVLSSSFLTFPRKSGRFPAVNNFPRTVTIGLSEEHYRKLCELAAAHDFAPRPGTLARVMLADAIEREWNALVSKPSRRESSGKHRSAAAK